MSFADEIRANMNKQECAPIEDIEASAREYVAYVKQCLLQKAQEGEGEIHSVKTGWLSSKRVKTIMCKVDMRREDYMDIPVPKYFGDSKEWFCTTNEVTQTKWNDTVIAMLKKEGIDTRDHGTMGRRISEYVATDLYKYAILGMDNDFVTSPHFEQYYNATYSIIVDI